MRQNVPKCAYTSSDFDANLKHAFLDMLELDFQNRCKNMIIANNVRGRFLI